MSAQPTIDKCPGCGRALHTARVLGGARAVLCNWCGVRGPTRSTATDAEDAFQKMFTDRERDDTIKQIVRDELDTRIEYVRARMAKALEHPSALYDNETQKTAWEVAMAVIHLVATA